MKPVSCYFFTGSTAKDLDVYFTSFYDDLVNHCHFLHTKYLNSCYNDEHIETLHTVYAKVKDRLFVEPLTGETILSSYVLFSLYTYVLSTKKRKRKELGKIDFNEITVQKEIYQILEEQEFFNNRQEYYDDLNALTRLLFKFVYERHSPIHSNLFLTYYLTNDNTYNKLEIGSGLKFSTVKKIMSTVKNDVKNNFKDYVSAKRSKTDYLL